MDRTHLLKDQKYPIWLTNKQITKTISSSRGTLKTIQKFENKSKEKLTAKYKWKEGVCRRIIVFNGINSRQVEFKFKNIIWDKK